MAGAASDAERRQVEEELRRVRDGVRERALVERTSAEVLPPAAPVRTPVPAPGRTEPPAPAPPPRPDTAGLGALWRTAEAAAGRLGRVARRLFGPFLDSQQRFNARQVQFDNDVLDYVEARARPTTHRALRRTCWACTAGTWARSTSATCILQEELVAHVHDLVKRIDLVLAEAERGRLALESALRDVRARLARLEERLGPADEDGPGLRGAGPLHHRRRRDPGLRAARAASSGAASAWTSPTCPSSGTRSRSSCARRWPGGCWT